MSFCTHCGSPLNNYALFCPKCGHKNLVITTQEEVVASSKKGKNKKIYFSLIIVLVVVIAVIGFFAFPQTQEETPFSNNPEAISQAVSSVVKLNCYEASGELLATGSGFMMFDEGVIITNYHVISDGVYSITGQMEDGLSFEVDSVLAYDEKKDIAILKAKAKTNKILLSQGDSTSMTKGEKVVAIGSPLGLLNTVSEGVFSGFITEDDLTFIQFTAAISSGSSGGPLFDDRGNVIGITSASFTEGQNLNLAVPIENVVALWDNRSSEATTMVEFYDSFVPPIPTYALGYVMEHCKELKGQEVYIEGYISSVQSDIYGSRFYMVNSIDDVLGYIITNTENAHAGYAEGQRANQGEAARIPFDENSYDIQPKDKVRIHCLVGIDESSFSSRLRGDCNLFITTLYDLNIIN